MVNNSVKKCCICNNEKMGEFISINDNKYHLCCIEDLKQENELLKRNCNIGNENLSFYRNENQQLHNKINKAIEYIESKNNGVCIRNGEEKGAYTFLLDFDKAREFVRSLLEILKDSDVK